MGVKGNILGKAGGERVTWKYGGGGWRSLVEVGESGVKLSDAR